MKLRNLLMTAVFLLAVTSSFAFKYKGSTFYSVTTTFKSVCYLAQTDQDCEVWYTGPQCTILFNGQITPIFETPTSIPCTMPLRHN